MTSTTMTSNLVNRWPTALGLLGAAGCITAILMGAKESEFGSAAAIMAGMYLFAYALNKPVTVWLAFPVMSAATTVVTFLGYDSAVWIPALLVVLWVWALVAGRAADGRLFTVQTVGMIAFGAITLATAFAEPTLGGVLAGLGFFAHGLWDVAHFRADKVVNRPWSEFCAVVDIPVGLTLIAAALLG
ncbi:hypothetical protein [Stackebrandtia nassauensis]|uniref:Uncharacterized protein n=1 Tax=Stackebrandtia nassauensis (strain DSM 44728 / CIP 108903 / NRRL B-16338 / NBRC 102104 / LLR-40K-21) TaxID=446470 RepID=D3PXQ0_STANL|nr:hypothetical protein [Stackebrandtia nassauensis]ADD43380.1 hypothetical protein Snas_3723 [Stackebrandtia nassauensis DSM 44728]